MSVKKKNRRKKVTMMDIAEKTGVSIATVSGVLAKNSSISVSPETRERILETARKSGYTYSAPPNGGRRKSSLQVWVLARYVFDNPMTKEILKGIEGELLSLKGKLLLNMQEDAVRTTLTEDLSFLDGIDGAIFISRVPNEMKAFLKAKETPYVIIGSGEKDDESDMVYCDPLGYAEKGLQYLESLGHRRIGLLAGPTPHYGYRSVIMSFRDHMISRKVDKPERLIKTYSDPEGMRKGFMEFLNQTPRPTAILGQFEGAWPVIEASGINVPEELSVVTFDAPGLFREKPFSYVGADNSELGIEGVRLLTRRVSDPQSGKRHILFPVRVFEHGSCAPPRTSE